MKKTFLFILKNSFDYSDHLVFLYNVNGGECFTLDKIKFLPLPPPPIEKAPVIFYWIIKYFLKC